MDKVQITWIIGKREPMRVTVAAHSHPRNARTIPFCPQSTRATAIEMQGVDRMVDAPIAKDVRGMVFDLLA